MIPTNEQETIALFSQLAIELGYRFKRMGTSCPDAILEQDGQEVRVEFEYKALNFQRHKHPVKAVDLIICWEDDWPSSPLPVLSLENYVMLAKPMPKWKRLLFWWKEWRITLAKQKLETYLARTKNHKRNYCPICASKMNFYCDYDERRWYYDYHQKQTLDGILEATCPNCGYLSYENVGAEAFRKEVPSWIESDKEEGQDVSQSDQEEQDDEI